MTERTDTTESHYARAEPTHLSGSFERDVVPLCAVLYRHALSFTTNSADAEDLVQETMLRAFKGYDNLQPETFLKAWLFTIMRNIWISRYRALSARPTETLLASIGDAEGTRPRQSGSAETEALRHEIGAPVSDMRQTEFQVSRTKIVAVAGEQKFDKLFAKGKNLRREDAVELALKSCLPDKAARESFG